MSRVGAAVHDEVRVAKRGTRYVEVGFAVVVVILAGWLGATGMALVWIGLGAWVVAYLGFVAVFPLRKCPRCKGSKTRSDGAEMLRRRGTCRRCDGDGYVRRAWARVFGWGLPDEDES